MSVLNIFKILLFRKYSSELQSRNRLLDKKHKSDKHDLNEDSQEEERPFFFKRLLWGVTLLAFLWSSIFPYYAHALEEEGISRFQVSLSRLKEGGEGIHLSLKNESSEDTWTVTPRSFESLGQLEEMSSRAIPGFQALIISGEVIGFSGVLKGLGNFKCLWDGSFSLSGTKGESLQTPFRLSIDSPGGLSLSHLDIRTLEARASSMILENKIRITEGSFESIGLEGKEGWCAVAPQANVLIDTFKMKKGHFINGGLIKGVSSSSFLQVLEGTNFGQISSLALRVIEEGILKNKGLLQDIFSIEGGGQFLNHARVEGLHHLNIRRVSNQQEKEGEKAQPLIKASSLVFGPLMRYFENGIDARLETDSLSLEPRAREEGSKLAFSMTLLNRGDFILRNPLRLEDTHFSNAGKVFLPHLSLVRSHLVNESYAFLSQDESSGAEIHADSTSRLQNRGSLFSRSTLLGSLLKAIGGENEGSWTHEGDVSATEERDPYSLKGKIHFKNGAWNITPLLILLKGSKVTFEGTGDRRRASSPLLSVLNLGSLVFDGIYNQNLFLQNVGEAHFKSGRYIFQFLKNAGLLKFYGNWKFTKVSHVYSNHRERHRQLREALLRYSSLPREQEEVRGWGRVWVEGNLTYDLPFGLENLTVVGNYSYLHPQPTNILKSMESLTCHGQASVTLDREEYDEREDEIVEEEVLDLRKIKHLTINLQHPLHVYGKFFANQLSIRGRDQLYVGSSPDFGEIYTFGGGLDIELEHGMSLESARLYSKGDITLKSVHGLITLGGLTQVPADSARWLGFVRTSASQALHAVSIFERNGAAVSSEGDLTVEGPFINLHGIHTLSKGRSTFKATRRMEVIRAFLTGHEDGVFEGPHIEIKTKGQGSLSVRDSWGCPNGCGFSGYSEGRSPVLSDKSEVMFMRDILFNSPNILISASALRSGRTITGLIAGNHKITELSEGTSQKYHECKNRGRFANYRYGAAYQKVFPSILQAGQDVLLTLGEGLLAGVNLSTQRAYFKAENVRFTNPSTGRETTAQITMNVDWRTFLQQQMRQGNSLFQLRSDGSIQPVLPMSGTSLREAGPLPILMPPSWKRVPGLAAFNPMEQVPLELLMQSTLGQVAGRLYMGGGLSGRGLFDHILETSQQMAQEFPEETADEESQQKALQERVANATMPFLYYMLQAVGSRLELRPHLHIPALDINPYQAPGDISAKELLVETEGNAIFEGTRIGVEGDITTQAKGSVVRQANPLTGLPHEIISDHGSVRTYAGADIIDLGSQMEVKGGDVEDIAEGHIFTGAQPFVTQKADGDTRTTKVLQILSRRKLGGHNRQRAGKTATLQAVRYDVDGDVIVEASGGIALTSAVESETRETRSSKKGTFGTKKSLSTSQDARELTSVINSGRKVELLERAQDIRAVAPRVVSRAGILFSAPLGRVIFDVARDTVSHMSQTQESSALVQSISARGSSASIVREAFLSPGEGELAIETQALYARLRAQGSEFEQQLGDHLKRAFTERVADQEDSWRVEHKSLGAPLMAAIAIVAGVATAGVASSVTVAESVALTAAVKASMAAAAASLSTKAIASVYANDGNLGKVLGDLTSKETIEQVVHTMAVSGLTAGIARGLGVETSAFKQELTDRIQQEAIRSMSEIGVSAALGERDLGSVVERALRGGVSNVITGVLAKETGAAFKGDAIPEPMQKALHGAIAAVGGVIEGSDPAARAVGAVAGEFVGERVRDHLLDGRSLESLPDEDYEALSDKVTAISQLTAVGMAALLGQDPFAAMHAAEIAVRNNCVMPMLVLPEGMLKAVDFSDAEIAEIKEDSEKRAAAKRALALKKELEASGEGLLTREKLLKISRLLQRGEALAREYPITTKILRGSLLAAQVGARAIYYAEAVGSGAAAGATTGVAVGATVGATAGAVTGAILGFGAAWSAEGVMEQSFALTYEAGIERLAALAESRGLTFEESCQFRETVYTLGERGAEALSIAGFVAGARGMRGIGARIPRTPSMAGDLATLRLQPQAYRAVTALESEELLGLSRTMEGLDLASQEVVRAHNRRRVADSISSELSANNGRSGRQARLKELASDDKLGTADRGWLQQELTQKIRGKRKNLRVPPGKELAHRRGFEAAKGYDYSYAELQSRDLHKLQHKFDGQGQKNKASTAQPLTDMSHTGE